MLLDLILAELHMSIRFECVRRARFCTGGTMEGSSVYNCRGTSVTRIGYARILWSSRYGKCGIEGALEYFGKVGTWKL